MTPFQAELHTAHKARLQRLGAIPPRVMRPIPKPAPEPVEPVVEEVGLRASKKAWFLIVDEIDPPPARVSIRHVQQAVAKHYNLSVLDLISPKRTKEVMLPRQIGYYLSHKLSGRSFPEIGRRFNKSDHTAPLSGVRKIERLIKTDAALAKQVDVLVTKLGGARA